MFRLLYFKVSKHPQLGEVEFKMVEKTELNNSRRPYTTVIIGANGTGKSYILRTVAEIFRQFNNQGSKAEKNLNFSFGFHLRYQYYDNTYEIATSSLNFIGKKRIHRVYIFFKNRPFESNLDDKTSLFEKKIGFEIAPSELEYPDRIIVSSIMLNDRFTFAESTPEDFYQYLGVRRTRSITSTQTFSKKTIRYLFDAKKSENFISDFSGMLDFMNFERFFKIHYNTKYKSLFFSGNLTERQFHAFYREWWTSGFTKRKESSRPWGLWYYEKIERGNPGRFREIIDYLNNAAVDRSKVFSKYRSRTKRFEIDLFNSNSSKEEYDLVEELIKLDILNLEGIKVKKLKNELAIEESSSGEYHLLISLLGLYSKIRENSLILIDEPEISLHPNWQMRYVSFLKNMFKRYPGCHFVLTTHSHFLVSDLEGESSSVISLSRDLEENVLSAELLEGKDTFGWSAEEILYRVFKVRTTRNFYLEADLRELLHLIATKSDNTDRMKNILENVSSLALSEQDPLNIIVEKANDYLNK